MVDVTTDQAQGAYTARDQEGYVRNVTVNATVEATQALNDVIRFVRVPSNARILSIKGSIGSSASAGAINVGVYNEGASGTVVDADLFASAQAITAGLAKTELITESGEYSEAEQAQPLWQAAGLSEDPQRYLVIAATVSTAFVGSDTSFTLDVTYTTSN